MGIKIRHFVYFFYSNIVLMSPYIEVLLRRFYWKFSTYFKKFRPNGSIIKNKTPEKVDFDKVLTFLRKNGVTKGSLIIVHSSYDALESTGLSEEEIIDKILALIGDEGTLAMPAIRKYKEEPKYDDILKVDNINTICTYNLRKTRITSGLLPYCLLKRKNSFVSKHPLNPLVAIGPLAEAMMEKNIEGNAPSPHGENSAWKFCVDRNAIVIGLGVDLQHYNTIIHVAEEAYGDWRWNDDEWFRIRDFNIVDGDFFKRISVKERKPFWGMLNIAEMNLYRDLIKNNIIKKTVFEGNLCVCVENSKELIGFLRKRNKRGYPYFKI